MGQPREAHSHLQHPEPCFCPQVFLTVHFFTSLSVPPELVFSVSVSTVRLSSKTAPGVYS